MGARSPMTRARNPPSDLRVDFPPGGAARGARRACARPTTRARPRPGKRGCCSRWRAGPRSRPRRCRRARSRRCCWRCIATRSTGRSRRATRTAARRPPTCARCGTRRTRSSSAASPPDNDESAALRRTLFDDYAPRALAVSDADAARARAFAEALVWDLDAPRRRVERVLVQRWLRVALAAAVALALLIGGRVVMLGPNLAAGKPFRLSSTFSGWAGCVANNGCNGLMFHTETENNPWVEIDLGAPKKVRRIEVINRGDCCADRATPLVAEVSTDRAVVDAGRAPRRAVRHLEGELPAAGRALRAAARRPAHRAAPAGDRACADLRRRGRRRAVDAAAADREPPRRPGRPARMTKWNVGVKIVAPGVMNSRRSPMIANRPNTSRPQRSVRRASRKSSSSSG